MKVSQVNASFSAFSLHVLTCQQLEAGPSSSLGGENAQKREARVLVGAYMLGLL